MQNKKLTKIVGLKKEEFDSFVASGVISLSPARLIPIFKVGDEKALASVILSSIKLIKEFREFILSDAKMIKSGQVYVYTEVSFDPKNNDDKSRPDGLLIVVKGGVIKDAAIFEMKNGKSVLEPEQIERYQQIARNYSIPKFITFSNQFVSEPSQFPINIKTIKAVDLYHFSWTYLLTIAHVLLFKNNMNIADEDQVELMREVVSYLEYEKSGVSGFTQMKHGWGEVVEKINKGAGLGKNDKEVCEAVSSWQQEEKDMALALSRSLGVLVDSGEKRFKGKLMARIENDKDTLISKKHLISTLRVKGAVSDITVLALLEKRAVEMNVALNAPTDKTLRGQFSWVIGQLENCERHDKKTFSKLKGEILIELIIKNSRAPERILLDDLDRETYKDERFSNKIIREVRIIYHKDFGRPFALPKKFVEIVEEMLVNYYSGIIQYLTKWEQSAPKMPKTFKEKTTHISDAHNELITSEQGNSLEVQESSGENESAQTESISNELNSPTPINTETIEQEDEVNADSIQSITDDSSQSAS